MTEYGVTSAGFRAKMQQEIIADINAALQATFGANINLGAESVFGQLVGVFSEREALLWQLAEAVYASQYPGGAEGVSVDNILALNNLTRRPASATVTDPTPATQTNGIVLYGLVLYGDPGTVIPAGSQIRSATTPVYTFTLDADVTIGASSDASQNIVLSNAPTQGSYQLAVVDAAGNTLTTPAISYETYATETQLLWPSAPSTGTLVLMLHDKALPPIDSTWGAAGIQDAVRELGGAYSAATVSGSFAYGLTMGWAGEFNPLVSAAPTLLTFSATPTTGAYSLTVGGTTTASLAYNASPATVRAALVAAGYPRAEVASVVLTLDNLFPGNVRTGTDKAHSTAGFDACIIDNGYALGGDAYLSSSSAVAYEGTRSLHVACGEGDRQGAAVRVAVSAGTQYTFSAYARAASGSLSLTPGVFYNVAGGALSAPVVVNAASWTRITVTVTVPVGQTMAQFVIGESSDTSAQFYLDGFKLQAAASATAWSDLAGVPGLAIHWVGSAAPTVSVATNTLAAIGAVSLSVGSGYSMDEPVSVVQSLQAHLANLYDATTGQRPFTDLAVVDGGGTLFTVNFGALTPQSGQPSSGDAPQPLMTVVSNALQQSSSVTNVAVSVLSPGSGAQGVGTATCSVDGPKSVVAGQLSVIGSPLTGWTGVTNQLDCLPGTDVETDTEALARRSQLASSQARGPVESIVDKVLGVPGVTTAIGFSNTTAAALQVLTFSSPPFSGNFRLALGGGATANIPYSATSATVQAAINAVPGYGTAVVTGGMDLGFEIDFNGSQGAQAQPLIHVIANTTGATANVAYGRSPKSFEIVVEGGAPSDIAQTIYDAAPAGISSYGTPAATTLGSMTQGSQALTVAAASGILLGQGISGLGVPSGATVGAVAGTSVTMSAAALGTYSDTPVVFSWSGSVSDAFGNPVVVSFSRPTPVLFYVTVDLVTDQYRTPGVASSGVNPRSQFRPGSVAQIQADIVAIGNATPIGGLVIGAGTRGLIGGFNEVPGVVGYQLSFGVNPSPSTSDNVQLLPTQVAVFQQFNVAVSWS